MQLSNCTMCTLYVDGNNLYASRITKYAWRIWYTDVFNLGIILSKLLYKLIIFDFII